MYQNSLHPNSNMFTSKPKTILCISNNLEKQIALRAKHLNLARKVKYLHSILQVLRFPVNKTFADIASQIYIVLCDFGYCLK